MFALVFVFVLSKTSKSSAKLRQLAVKMTWYLGTVNCHEKDTSIATLAWFKFMPSDISKQLQQVGVLDVSVKEMMDNLKLMFENQDRDALQVKKKFANVADCAQFIVDGVVSKGKTSNLLLKEGSTVKWWEKLVDKLKEPCSDVRDNIIVKALEQFIELYHNIEYVLEIYSDYFILKD